MVLGASSMLLNAVSFSGSALVAMLAGVPVLVCCETYKFTDRVLLDAICWQARRPRRAGRRAGSGRRHCRRARASTGETCRR